MKEIDAAIAELRLSPVLFMCTDKIETADRSEKKRIHPSSVFSWCPVVIQNGVVEILKHRR